MFDDLIKEVDNGIAGLNKGISMGFPKLEEYIYGIQRHRYDLVFAEDGVGKSSFALTAYVMNPYLDMLKKGKEKDLKIKLFSLEVSRVNVMAKLLAMRLYTKYNLVVDPAFLLSKGSNKITTSVYNLIKKEKVFFDKMLSTSLDIIDKPCKPSDIKRIIDSFASRRGTISETTNEEGELIKQYTPINKNEYVIIVVDTVGNLALEQNGGLLSTKGTIDLHSSNCVNYYRNLYNYLIVNVSHSNRSIGSTDRVKFGELFPKKSDIKETNMLAQDANTIICLFNPMDHLNDNNTLNNLMGYDILKLKERFRALGVLKNREGSANIRIGLRYTGECGYFEELPAGKDMSTNDYLKIQTIKHAKTISDADINQLNK